MASVRSLKRRLKSTSLIDKCKALRRSRKVKVAFPLQENMELLKIRYHIGLNKNKRFFEAVEENNVSKKGRG